jgi:hypothetical protein
MMRQAEKNAVSASYFSGYLEVIMGVIFERINNCGTKDWQHGFRALKLLETLLLNGSIRVYIMALSLLPLLRHLIMPTLHSAVLAGECAAVWAGWRSHCDMIQAANMVSKERGSSSGKNMAVVVGAVSGASDVKEGTASVSKQGVSPRRSSFRSTKFPRLVILFFVRSPRFIQLPRCTDCWCSRARLWRSARLPASPTAPLCTCPRIRTLCTTSAQTWTQSR